MRTSTRVSGTDAMADHVETLASRSTQADVPRQATAGAPLLHAIWRFCRRKPLGALGGAIVLVTSIGITSGYLGGKYDLCVQRVVDAWQSFPFLVVILSIMAVLGPGLLNIILALGFFGAANASRVVRGATVSVAQNVYIEAARALGAGHVRVMVRHILPNVAATIIVWATIGLGAFILAESALSFLGFGVPPPYPSWGGMLSGSGRSFFSQAPWIAIYPGLAISLAVFGFNMLGDALRDVLDPRLRGVGGRMR